MYFLNLHTQLWYVSLLFSVSKGVSSPSLFLWVLTPSLCLWLEQLLQGWGFWVHSTGAPLPVMLILSTAATLSMHKNSSKTSWQRPLPVSCFQRYTHECVQNVILIPLGGCDALHNKKIQSALFPHWESFQNITHGMQLTDYFTRIISPTGQALTRPEILILACGLLLLPPFL